MIYNIDELEYPVPIENVTGIHVGMPEYVETDIPDHLAEALSVAPIERCVITDARDGYDDVLKAHARLMMERDLRGLRLCKE